MGHIVEHITNESDWHKGRSKGIGGSDVACLLGYNPHKSNIDLWKEKTGRKQPQDIGKKPCVIYGKKAEDLLRQLFILDYPQYKVTHSPYDLHIHNDYPFIRASLDGELLEILTSNKGIFECKTTEIHRPQDWKKWKNQIPMNYFCQVLHYFAVDEDYKFCKLKAQIKSKEESGETILTTKHYHIDRFKHLNDIEQIINAEIEFWHYVEADKEPPLILPQI